MFHIHRLFFAEPESLIGLEQPIKLVWLVSKAQGSILLSLPLKH